ncbi:hypothetical protein Daus18300_007202 [Diaporthe australafricana]|uniref:Phospholipase A2 n=1 Tax=Diaporthe australafricana TaxID=127596 RepID=A0ABR3WPC6_9PEZI
MTEALYQATTGAVEDQADRFLFNITLESFMYLRDLHYPSYFDWDSDGCSQSPDAPFGFPFLPACYRHDFGYDQYKKQGRFTPEGKDSLDRNFREDLYHQCSAPGLQVDVCQACAEDPHRKDIDCKHRTDMCKFPAQDVCKCLGDMYYAAVVKFGKEKRAPVKIPKISDIKVPSFDVASLGLCLNKNLHSADDKPVD